MKIKLTLAILLFYFSYGVSQTDPTDCDEYSWTSEMNTTTTGSNEGTGAINKTKFTIAVTDPTNSRAKPIAFFDFSDPQSHRGVFNSYQTVLNNLNFTDGVSLPDADKEVLMQSKQIQTSGNNTKVTLTFSKAVKNPMFIITSIGDARKRGSITINKPTQNIKLLAYKNHNDLPFTNDLDKAEPKLYMNEGTAFISIEGDVSEFTYTYKESDDGSGRGGSAYMYFGAYFNKCAEAVDPKPGETGIARSPESLNECEDLSGYYLKAVSVKTDEADSSTPANPIFMDGTFLKPGATLQENEAIVSNNGECMLHVSKDGKLVIDKIKKSLDCTYDASCELALKAVVDHWQAPTTKGDNTHYENAFTFNHDCSLHFINKNGDVWDTNNGAESCVENSKLVITDNCQIQVKNGEEVVWENRIDLPKYFKIRAFSTFDQSEITDDTQMQWLSYKTNNRTAIKKTKEGGYISAIIEPITIRDNVIALRVVSKGGTYYLAVDGPPQGSELKDRGNQLNILKISDINAATKAHFISRIALTDEAGASEFDWVSFESVLNQGHFINHRNYDVFCGKQQPESLYKKDATWHIEPVKDFVKGIVDGDGNIYKSITIGDQEWLTTDLRTTTCNDGTPIPLVTDNSAWGALSGAGYSWYENYETPTYGALYNWYAVNTCNICPVGWHVPTDEEFTVLTDYLGGLSSAGTKMKENGGWSGLQGGYRDLSGDFSGQSRYKEYAFGNWWSTTGADGKAWVRTVGGRSIVYRNEVDKKYGYSVRCIKD